MAKDSMAAYKACAHAHVFIGLDCVYCSDCGAEFLPGTTWYETHMNSSRYKQISLLEELGWSPEKNGSCVDATHEPNESTHEHTLDSSPLMWVQVYSVKRRGTKHKYYRFCYLTDPKKIGTAVRVHLPGGNIESERAIFMKERVEEAIEKGMSPTEIEQLIRG